MTARNTEVRLEMSSGYQGWAETLLLPVFRSVLTITGVKSVAASSPTLQGTESDLPYSGKREENQATWLLGLSKQ